MGSSISSRVDGQICLMGMANSCFIGWANDDNLRYRATSGGVGSALVKYCFERGLITYAMTFVPVENSIIYQPRLIKT